jgi:signal transduction histidine kinase
MIFRKGWRINKYLWGTLLFVGLYIPFAYARGSLSVSLPVAFGVFALSILNAAARTYSAWLCGGYNDEKRGWTFNVIDVLLISLAVWMTRGIHSELWLLYYVLLISESLFAPPGQTRLLIGLMVLGYGAATWPGRPDAGYFLILFLRLFFLALIGEFARQLSMVREERNREIALLREQVAASDERARIAREVHDGLGHALVSSILRLELCLRLLRRDPDEAEKLLQEEVPALRAAWNEGRDLAFHLRPWERDEAGFEHSLRRHVGRFSERTGLTVDLAMEGEEWNLPPETEFALTRILQEALTNVAKHAKASQVCIRLVRRDDMIRCLIRDDGVGFEPETQTGSFGLNAMRERAEKLSGSLTVSSRPGEGTTVQVELPVA